MTGKQPKTPAKNKSPNSKLNARLDKINQAAKKLADEKVQLALKVQKQQEEKELKEQKKAVKLQKAADKEREQALKRQIKWTDDAKYDLIAAYKDCLELYLDTNSKAIGFAPRSAFRKEFFDNEVHRARHNLESWDGDQCLQQIEALTDLYKRTGGGGLNDTLERHQMPEQLYNAVRLLYQDHKGVNVTDITESGVNNDKDTSDDVSEAGGEVCQDGEEDMDLDLDRLDDVQFLYDAHDEPEVD
ncbi:hypothetical protein HDU80_003388, partial [Chytriomyces hyalinus]